MNKVDYIDNLVKSYEAELRKDVTNFVEEYTVTAEWLIQQYVKAFEQGVIHGLNSNVVLLTKQREVETQGVDKLLRKVLTSKESFKDLAKKINLE